MRQAEAVYRSGIYTFAVVDGQEIEIGQALLRQGAMLVGEDDLGDIDRALEEWGSVRRYCEDDDDAPYTPSLDDVIRRLRELVVGPL